MQDPTAIASNDLATIDVYGLSLDLKVVMSSLSAVLHADAILSEFSPGLLARLVGSAEVIEKAKGDLLYSIGDSADYVYLVEARAVELLFPSGKAIPLQESRCGNEALCGLSRYLSSCRVLAATKVIRVHIAQAIEPTNISQSIKQKAITALSSAFVNEKLSDLTIERAGKATNGISFPEILGWVLTALLPLLVYQQVMVRGGDEPLAIFLALMGSALGLWVFRLVDEFIPPLIVIVGALFIGLVPPEVALSGFSSSGLLTFLGVFVLAMLVSASGLSYRVVLWLLRRLPDKPGFHQAAMLLVGYLLSTLSPSANSRMALVLSLFRDMRQVLGLEKQSKGSTALMASCFSGAMLMAAMFATSRSASLTAIQMLPLQMRETFSGIYWFIASAAAALVTTIMHFFVAHLFFKESQQVKIAKDRLNEQVQVLGNLTSLEKTVLFGCLLFVLGSSTVSLHHIPQAWLAGLLLVVFLILGVVNKKDFRQKIDWPMIFFLLGIDCLTEMMKVLGVNDLLTQHVASNFEFIDQRLELFVFVALAIVCFIRLILPVTAGMLVSCIILLPIAQMHGIHPWICLFLAASFSDIWFFEYQCSTYMQIKSGGFTHDFDVGTFKRYCRIMDLWRLVAAFVSIPYWRWLGLA